MAAPTTPPASSTVSVRALLVLMGEKGSGDLAVGLNASVQRDADADVEIVGEPLRVAAVSGQVEEEVAESRRRCPGPCVEEKVDLRMDAGHVRGGGRRLAECPEQVDPGAAGGFEHHAH